MVPPPLPPGLGRFALNGGVAAARPKPAPPPALPADVYATILSMCSPRDAAQCALASRAWWGAFRSPVAWSSVDLTPAGPFQRASASALAAFLAFLLADGRAGGLRSLSVCHRFQAVDDPAAEPMPCELAWDTAASILAAAPSLRSLTLLGPPPPPASPALCHPQLRTAHLAVHAWTVATLDVLSSSPGLEELTLVVHLEVRSTLYHG